MLYESILASMYLDGGSLSARSLAFGWGGINDIYRAHVLAIP
jgi:hypothetical protein